MTVDVQIAPEPESATGIEFIPNLDVLSEGDLCSCAAGDDNPF